VTEGITSSVEFTIRLARIGPSKNQLAQIHWGAKGRWVKEVRDATALQAKSVRNHTGAAVATNPRTVQMTVIRGKGAGRTLDEDGCMTALAPAVDGLRDAGWLRQDDPQSAHLLTPIQRRDKAMFGVAVVVRIWPGIIEPHQLA